MDSFAPEHNLNLRCRFYENEFPEVDELVLVHVERIDEMGAYVSLLEYDNRQAMILLSEITRKRARTLATVIRVGRQECAVVLRVDTKGYIDLSKRRLMQDDLVACEAKFYKGKTVHNIFINVAQTCKVDLKPILQAICWPLYRKYKHAFDALTKFVGGHDIFADLLEENPNIPKEWINATKERVLKVMAPQAVKIRTEFELTCTGFEGVEALKSALNAGVAHGNQGEIEAKLIAPPLYVLSLTSEDKDGAINKLNGALEAVKAEIEKNEGSMVIKTAPRAVSQQDDRMLHQMMVQAERENREVSGDQDED
ncbi:hypothetical protein P9112_006260 [Eukaryota sp. TZLM1-RC]